VAGKSNQIRDPLKEYRKPKSIEIKISGEGEFPALEAVFHNILNTLEFKRVESLIEDESICFVYKPKGSHKLNDKQ
jgi:hypothetical protein